MDDYERGLLAFKECLLKKPASEVKEALSEFYVLESTLKENLHRTRLFGDNETRRSNRAEIIYALNQLASDYCGISFNELCERQPDLKPKGSLRPSSGSTQTPPLNVSTEVLTRTMPTAYCYNLSASDFPFVTVTLDNTAPGSKDIPVLVSAVVDNYSDPDTTAVSVVAQKKEHVSLLPPLRPSAIATLNDTQPATLRVVIERNTSPKDVINTRTFPIRLHARNTALLALKKPDDSIKDLSDYLAAWVTPRHPEIEKMLPKAARHHSRQELVGYVADANTLPELAITVREQARAIFNALRDINLVYVDSAGLEVTSEQVTQHVRLPGDTLMMGGAANCIDASVLFASLLMAASIDPVLVLVPGHSFVGWHIWRSVNQYEFLEMTEINKGDFDAAQQSAQRRYDKAQIKGHHERPLFDPNGFLRVIDVVACRKKGILPLGY